MRIALDGLNIRRGGGQTVLMRVAKAFAAHGHDAVVFTAGGRVAEGLRALDQPGLSVREVPAATSPLGALRYRYTGWDRACAKVGCDFAFGFNYWIPTALPQATYHINVIPFLPLGERIAAVGLLRAIVLARYARLALRRSRLNLFESRHVRDLATVEGYSISHPEVAYIGVDLPDPIPARTGAERYLAAVTSPAPHKHNEHLFALHRRLNRNRAPDERIGLHLVGVTSTEIAERPETRVDAEYAADRHDIAMLGYLGRDELYRELAGALALVSFSELESFYMVALEAMAVGCPTITTDISSVAESVGEVGLTVPCGDIEAAARNVERLEEPAFRADLGRRSRARAEEFAADACAARIVDLTIETLGAR